MHAMAEWYMRGEQYDQAKLSRILDVAQDLKVSGFERHLSLFRVFMNFMFLFIRGIKLASNRKLVRTVLLECVWIQMLA